MTKADHTDDPKRAMGEFIPRAGKTFLVVRCGDLFDHEQTICVTPDDVAEFYASQDRNLTAGCRTGTFDPKLRELACLKMTHLSDCHVCRYYHEK